jgi:hypothetical protein
MNITTSQWMKAEWGIRTEPCVEVGGFCVNDLVLLRELWPATCSVPAPEAQALSLTLSICAVEF